MPSSDTCICLEDEGNFDQYLNPSSPSHSKSETSENLITQNSDSDEPLINLKQKPSEVNFSVIQSSVKVKPKPTPNLSISVDSLEEHQINNRYSQNNLQNSQKHLFQRSFSDTILDQPNPINLDQETGSDHQIQLNSNIFPDPPNLINTASFFNRQNSNNFTTMSKTTAKTVQIT